MSEICPVCGLPKELCVCDTIGKDDQNIVIRSEKKRFGKVVTIIEGFDPKSVDMNDLLKTLKRKFACGGTVRDNSIELQGNHKNDAKKVLIDEGFSEASIHVK